MNLSKFLKTSPKRNLFLAILILGFYGLGYLAGVKPRSFFGRTDSSQNEIYFYLQDPNLLPANLRQYLVSHTGVKIKFIADDPEISDVWLGDLDLLKNAQPALDQPQRSDWLSIFMQISPDFQLSFLRDKHFLPILWRPENTFIRLYGLWIANEKTDKLSVILNLEKVFVSTDFQSKWLETNTWNTTVLKMDEMALPENRKASSIRKIELKNLHWNM